MEGTDPNQSRLNRLRQWRNPVERDVSLGFLKKKFKAEVERPHKQLQDLIPLWEALVPQDLCPRTRLAGFTRGTLHVAVDSSSTLYQLDRLLRSGLERELIKGAKRASLHRVKLRVGM